MVTMRHLHVLYVVEELNKGLASNQCLGVTALDDMLFMDCLEGTELFLTCSVNLFMCRKDSVFYDCPSYHCAFSSLNQV